MTDQYITVKWKKMAYDFQKQEIKKEQEDQETSSALQKSSLYIRYSSDRVLGPLKIKGEKFGHFKTHFT